MTRVEAIRELMWDHARNARRSVASYKRVQRACRVLALDAEESRAILVTLGYIDYEGKPYPWLAAKLAVQRAKEKRPEAG